MYLAVILVMMLGYLTCNTKVVPFLEGIKTEEKKALRILEMCLNLTLNLDGIVWMKLNGL